MFEWFVIDRRTDKDHEMNVCEQEIHTSDEAPVELPASEEILDEFGILRI